MTSMTCMCNYSQYMVITRCALFYASGKIGKYGLVQVPFLRCPNMEERNKNNEIFPAKLLYRKHWRFSLSSEDQPIWIRIGAFFGGVGWFHDWLVRSGLMFVLANLVLLWSWTSCFSQCCHLSLKPHLFMAIRYICRPPAWVAKSDRDQHRPIRS